MKGTKKMKNEKQTKTTKQTTKTQATKSMLDVIRTTNQHDEILQALAKKDLENLNNKNNSFLAKRFVELVAYYLFTQLNEQATINLTCFKSVKSLRILTNCLPYILGVKGFSISFEKEITNIELTINKPYGTYREGLESEGLIFLEQTKEQEEILKAEQQDTVNEANSLLASVGLNQYIK